MSRSKSKDDVAVKTMIEPALDIDPPKMFSVIYLNDDQTPVDFVIESLIDVFDHSYTTAEDLAYYVHENGSAVAAVLPYELAEMNALLVMRNARSQGYPLQLKLEPDA